MRDLPGSSLQAGVALGTFRFGKLFMWRDLKENSDRIVRNRTVRHIADNPSQPYVWGGDIPPSDQLDDIVDPGTLFTPLATDASQLAAVMASRNDADFVMAGPPGTGKSQTIANIIAQGLADGRRILFSAQKQVAMDVVYERLEELGLHQLCLCVRSGTPTTRVIQQLEDSWHAASEATEEAPLPSADRERRLRDGLNRYPRLIHEKHPNGCTVHWALGAVADTRDLPPLGFSWPTPWAHDKEEWDRLAAVASKLGRLVPEQLRDPRPSLKLVVWPDWSRSWEDDLLTAAKQLIAATDKVENAATHLCRELETTDHHFTIWDVNQLRRLQRSIRRAPSLDLGFVFLPDADIVMEYAREGVRRFEAIGKHRAKLSTTYPPWRKVLTKVDVNEVRRLRHSKRKGDRAEAERIWQEKAQPSGSFKLAQDVDLWIEISREWQEIKRLGETLRAFPAWRGTGSKEELKKISELLDTAEALIGAASRIGRELADLISPSERLLETCEGL